ncbi:MAG TPA: glycerophosphodiester phosphodiesterase family protein [Bacteroidota bacterium]|nr:glycerophosphodiester phosphodiesterase family protein [Bacteroidota bacterium]
MRLLLILCLCPVLFVSCRETPSVITPDTGTDILAQTNPIKPSMRPPIEGVYSVTAGNDVFGDQFALKWSYVVSANFVDTTFTLSIFAGKDMAYFDLQGGTLDSVFLFTGYWRKMTNTETGAVRLTIPKTTGGRLLFGPRPIVNADSIVFTGNFGSGTDAPTRALTFRYNRPLYSGRQFEVLAHRGGGRTSDLLPVSENSVEMILFTPRLGSTGIEIDLRLTKDGVPILYHDNTINTRLTQKSGLVGTIEEYTYAQLQAFVTLIHGEKIPTLQQVLDAALYRTPIRTVYLDNKNSADLAMEVAIQKDYTAKAAAAGRTFHILIGLPTTDKVNEFLALPDYASAPSLCELTIDDTRNCKSLVWAPRWTLGTQVSDVAQMHAEGRKVVTWTMDVPQYVQQYVLQGDFDGILTNYSPMVAYYNYTRQ